VLPPLPLPPIETGCPPLPPLLPPVFDVTPPLLVAVPPVPPVVVPAMPPLDATPPVAVAAPPELEPALALPFGPLEGVSDPLQDEARTTRKLNESARTRLVWLNRKPASSFGASPSEWQRRSDDGCVHRRTTRALHCVPTDTRRGRQATPASERGA
jgi:hypothetical protein